MPCNCIKLAAPLACEFISKGEGSLNIALEPLDPCEEKTLGLKTCASLLQEPAAKLDSSSESEDEVMFSSDEDEEREEEEEQDNEKKVEIDDEVKSMHTVAKLIMFMFCSRHGNKSYIGRLI